MSFILSPHAQGTPEWLADRAGKLTGSNADNIYATIKSGEAAAKRDERIYLALERVTGKPRSQGFISSDMKLGTEREPFARMAVEAELGCSIIEQGFCYLPDIAAGGSVDGLIDPGTDNVGLFEAKCPKENTHWGYWQANVLPPAYVPQVTHNVWVTGAQYAIFCSFHPDFPPETQLLCVRIERSALKIDEHEAKVRAFLKEVDALEDQIRNARRT